MGCSFLGCDRSYQTVNLVPLQRVQAVTTAASQGYTWTGNVSDTVNKTVMTDRSAHNSGDYWKNYKKITSKKISLRKTNKKSTKCFVTKNSCYNTRIILMHLRLYAKIKLLEKMSAYWYYVWDLDSRWMIFMIS